MADGAGIPPEAVPVVRNWCKRRHGLVAWGGARRERPGDHPADAFLVLQGAHEEARGRLALDLLAYLVLLRALAAAVRRCEEPIPEHLWDAAGKVARWEVAHRGLLRRLEGVAGSGSS